MRPTGGVLGTSPLDDGAARKAAARPAMSRQHGHSAAVALRLHREFLERGVKLRDEAASRAHAERQAAAAASMA